MCKVQKICRGQGWGMNWVGEEKLSRAHTLLKKEGTKRRKASNKIP